MHPEFAPVAFIAAFSLIFPLPWHWRAGNVATLSIIGWLFVINMIYAVDAVIWANSVDIVVPVWCDITTKLIIGANFSLPAACLCICIHLEQVSSVRLARTSLSDKRRRQYFEALMCLGLPVIFMALHYVVQGHRFDIIENYGCRPSTYFSIPAIFIVWLPPILIAIGALVFAALALRHFMIRRLSFAAHLSSSNSSLTPSRYLRLMVMSALQMFWSLVVTAYALWFTVTAVRIRPWTTWADVHSDWLRIDLFPALFTPPFVERAFYVLWWLVPVSTFLFVGFFSFGKDATDEYKRCISWFKTRVLRRPESSKSFKGQFFSLPFSKKELSPISSPTLISSSNGSTSITMLTLSSSKDPQTPSSLDKSHSFGASPDCDTFSEASHYTSPYGYTGAKALGSVSELISPATPSTAAPEYQEVMHIRTEFPPTPAPITPPISHPRIRGHTPGNLTPLSPRPFTYPSNDPTHTSFDPSKFTR
ncbi:hypothetical protein NLJ89_g7634 [Agrocybe chaxingu]|uniref:Pheromone receptor n=1 Tax=Agrocybe chaxingu TaxID=84603 RepID=A0A9W8JWT2_9AGAR|nr:hypothetical protein NLJ89_g7634 [Agrocybe chaxingu]